MITRNRIQYWLDAARTCNTRYDSESVVHIGTRELAALCILALVEAERREREATQIAQAREWGAPPEEYTAWVDENESDS